MKVTRRLSPYLYIAPSFAFLVLFTYYPILRTLWLGFTKCTIFNSIPTFIGLANYRAVFNSDLFWQVIRNTLVYSLATVVFSVGLGLFLAVLLNAKMRLIGFYRSAFFYPTMLPLTAGSMVWIWMFSSGYGLINYYLRHLNVADINWLGSERWALIAVIIVGVWKYFGYYMILFLSGLQGIPSELYESGSLDGCVGWKRFRWITFPLLTPTTFFVGIVALINSVQVIDQIYVMTSGGPRNATNTLLYHVYQEAFQYWDTGYAATLSTILFVFLLLLTAVYFKSLQKHVHY